MSPEDSVDELIDKAIDEVLGKPEKDSEDINKRKPKPFRYITKEEEIQAELSTEEKPQISVMSESPVTKIVEDKLAILGLGDVQTIENVIQKHVASRKFIEK
jgi:hypothetical protein